MTETKQPAPPSDEIPLRLLTIIFVIFILFTVLGIRLWTMQVTRRADYTERSQRQSVRRIREPAVRGRILARDGQIIVDTRVSVDIKFHLAEMRASRQEKALENILGYAERIAERIGRSNPLTREAILRHLNYYPGIPMPVFKDLNEIELGTLWEMDTEIPGIEFAAEPVRAYPYGPLAAQILGYVGMADPRQADDRAEFFYYIADPIGKSGIEQICNEKLRGSPGQRLVLVNSTGFVHQELEAPTEAENGFDIRLTLDLEAQKIAEELIAPFTGSIVVLNANTGAVIAMASSPSFNPEDFVPKISSEKFSELNRNPNKPFLNRAISGSYMPGSIIKPLTALAALEAGIDPEETIDCTGRTTYGYGGGIRCNSRFGHGPLDLRHAIMRSCNVYFVDRAVEIGIDKLSPVYESAGIGAKTGIELSDRTGHLPRNTPRWSRSETAYVGFGQGKIEVTPLQAASYIAAIGNGGTLWKPYLIEQVLAPGTATNPVSVFDAAPAVRGRLAASKQNIQIVREGMFLVVNESGGSGSRAKNSKVEVFGKTGTADVVAGDDVYKNVWFAGFATDPSNGQTYSIVVLIERGDSGGLSAAPLVGQFFERWIP